MKNTIYKYFFYEFLRYFLITLFALAVIVWTIQSVNYLDLVTEDGHAFTTYFVYSILTLSKVLTKLIPFSFLVAIVLTIITLEKDNELIAIWTSGLNKIHIVNLIFRISLIIMLTQLILTSTINPTMLNLSRSILKSSQLQFIPSLMKEKEFNDTVEGLTIFVDKKDQYKNYHNIFIRDDGRILSNVGNTSSTIFAKSGYISENEKSLILLNGNIQNLKEDGNVNIIKFERTVLNLSGISTKSISEPKIQETSTLKILNCIKNKSITTHHCKQNKKSLMNIKIEMNKRFGMPIFIPLISLICSFLLSSRKDKKNYYYNKYIYFFIGVLILVLSEVVVRYSGISWTHTAFYYLLPAGMIPLFYFTLIRKFKYENLF
jgi:lipopolysaccharide export system permease protein